jgi:CheY-like chemotaxis protein
VAHEINNPLTYILYTVESLANHLPRLIALHNRCQLMVSERLGSGYAAEVLGADEDRGDPQQLEELVAWARDAFVGACRVRDIVRGLKTFSRADRDERAPVQLNSVIEFAINMAYNEIRYRARLVKDLGPLPMVMASDGRLSQVFLNLLINAAQAIDAGEVDKNEIRVSTWVEGGEICAEVRDTGEGIPQEHLSELFEPFFTTKAPGVGSGLGLSICRDIVASYGGRIEAASSPAERWTRFRVFLPIARGEARASASSRTPTPPVASAAVGQRRGRVLVVDDEPIIRRALDQLLSTEHEVVLAESGAAARALLERDRAFDLILCDLMMPEITGMDLHGWLVEQDPALAGKMIFMTGGAFTERASAFLRSVPNLTIEKPFDLRNLMILVRKQID